MSLCGVVATGPAAAAAAAAEVGLPVAVKVADPGVVHKTERGLVSAGLAYPWGFYAFAVAAVLAVAALAVVPAHVAD